ncbi:hypothetical protein H5410_015163 [Solanum commersonii]|uniref:Major facilitator superfamily (MFS) profile domain-containing protein n=1 Tax=Solanum commersonii TaxID=4109 RepID=A0A9J5ZTB6_SOLCO|nr:hypothetical protein H5410_015163 [Solanum commersonii]
MGWYNPTMALSKPPLLVPSNSWVLRGKKVIECRRNYPLIGRKKENLVGVHFVGCKGMLRLKVSASSGEGEKVEPGYIEEFSWSSVILPFFFIALGGLLFGYDIGATSGATISLQSLELSGMSWYNLSAVQLGLVVRVPFYGALISSILAYPFADFLGRRRELIITAILYLAGGSLTACAPGLGALLLGRLVYGLGIGLLRFFISIGNAWSTSIYSRDLSIPNQRDINLFKGAGNSTGYFAMKLMSLEGGVTCLDFSAPIALLMGFGMWTLPPSPRWLLLRAIQGKGPLQEYKENAIGALSKLRGRPASDKVSEKQIEDTIKSLKTAYTDEEAEGNFLEVLQGPSLKAFTIGGGLVLFQQITEQPSVLYYVGSILQSAGFSAAADAARVSVVIGIFKVS